MVPKGGETQLVPEWRSRTLKKGGKRTVLRYVSISELIDAILMPYGNSKEVMFLNKLAKDTHHLDATDNPLSEHSLTAFRSSDTICKSSEVMAAMAQH
jgi:hypothetical protein